MIEPKFLFMPADGSAPKDVVVRISDVRHTDPGGNASWSASVWIEWSGSGRDHRIRGMDPLHAVESAARFAAYHLYLYQRDGDGTFEPPLSATEE